MSRYAEADMLTPGQADRLAAELRRQRNDRGWSMKRLSAESGVPVSVIAHMEGRRSRALLVNAGKVAAALGATLADLTGGGP